MTNKPAQDRPTATFDFQAWFETWRQEYLFYRIDPQGVFTFISPNINELLGYQPAEVLGRHLQDFLATDHPVHEVLEDLSHQLWPGDNVHKHCCVAQRRDGKYVYFSAREQQILDEHGVHIATERMAHDDTLRVEAELLLRKKERKYRRLVEGIRGDYFIYTHLPDGEITYLSPSVEDVMGYKPADAIGKNWREFLGLENLGRQDAEQVEVDLLHGKDFHHLVVELDRPDSNKRLIEIQEHQIYDHGGKYVSMEGIARDITKTTRMTTELQELRDNLEARVAQRTAELQAKNAELRASEARYRRVVEMQGEFIVHWTPDFRRTFVNEAYARFLGKPAEELIGKPFPPVIAQEDLSTFQDAVKQLTPEHPTVSYEHRVRRVDGELFWAQWTDTAFFDDEGNPTEYLSVGRDVTELKDAEDTIRQKELHLAHVSRLATMGEMVAGIAHEVHQPLHAASAFAEAARRRLESGAAGSVETAIDCTREISVAITRTAKIIRRLRDFTKAGSVKMESLNLNQVVRESVEIVAFETRRAKVFPEIKLAHGLPTVLGDRIQLQQICVNLITNACEAMSEVPVGERELIIETYSDDEKTGVRFSDRGNGVDPADLDRIFDAFYTTKSGGMGMGLSICQSIAESHQAELKAQLNLPLPGITVSLEFPQSNLKLIHREQSHA